MTITNQVNPIGTTHTSKKSQIIVPKEGITGLESKTKEKIYTAVTLTRSSINPPKYRQQIIQYNDAKSTDYSVIATKNEEVEAFTKVIADAAKNWDGNNPIRYGEKS